LQKLKNRSKLLRCTFNDFTMKQTLQKLIAVIFVFFIAKEVNAENGKCLSATPLIVGVQSIAYSPHYDFVSDKQEGYFNDLIKWLEEKTQCTFLIRPLPIKRLKLSLRYQHIDFMYPDNPTWNKTFDIDRYYSVPVTTALGGTMVKQSNENTKLHAFNRLAFPRGFTPVAWYQLEDGAHIKFTEVSSVLATLKMVLTNRADGADIEYNVANYLVTKHKLEPLVLAKNLPFTPTHFHLSTYRQTTIMQQINQLISTNPEVISKLKNKHGIIEKPPF